MRRFKRSVPLCSIAALVGVLSGASLCQAVNVTLTVPRAEQVAEVRLLATAEAVALKTAEKRVDVRFSGAWDLDGKYGWRIWAEAPGLWSFPVEIGAGHSGNIDLALVPAGRINFSADPLAGPLQLELAFAARKTNAEAPSFEKYPARCSQLGQKATCTVPAGLLDLKLSQAGLVPKYLWSVEIPAQGETDLGDLRFARGGSIAGWIVNATDGKIEGVEVTANPRSTGFPAEPSTQMRAELRSVATRTNERGFFQLSGLAPGLYELTARARHADLSRKVEADVSESSETEIESGIEIRPPLLVELSISPPLDPYAKPWSIQLGKLVGKTIPSFEKVTAGDPGLWSLFPETTGEFDLTVTDSRGSSWHSAEVELFHGREPLFIDIERIEIEGRIRRGKEPITTRLVFGSTQGAVQLEMRSDDEGNFSGFLPRPGSWQVDLAGESEEDGFQTVGAVEVSPKPGSSRAFVEIELPDTLLKGRVIKDGQFVEEAQVMVLRMGDRKRREGQARTNAGGEFQFRGLELGKVIVQAIQGDLASEWIEVEITQEPRQEILIDLAEKITLSGQVHSGGQPIYGAVILLQPHLTNRVVSLERTYSLLDGEFQLKVPAESKAFDVLVRADGFGTRLFRFTDLQSNVPLMIELGRSRGRIELRTAAQGIQRQGELLLPLSLHAAGAQLGIRSLISIADFKITESGLALIDFAPGAYRICDNFGRCNDGQLPAGGEAVFEIKE